MNTIPILPARLDWPSAIGNFLLNYGTLDHLVFIFLSDHLSPEEFSKIKERNFKDRIARIARFMVETEPSEEARIGFKQFVERLEPIREFRNHIAHGHMYWRIDVESQQPAVTLLKAKDFDAGHLPETRQVEFAELQTRLGNLNMLIEDFQRLAGSTEGGSITLPQG